MHFTHKMRSEDRTLTMATDFLNDATILANAGLRGTYRLLKTLIGRLGIPWLITDCKFKLAGKFPSNQIAYIE